MADHFGEWLKTAVRVDESGIHLVGSQEEFLSFVENAQPDPRFGDYNSSKPSKPYALMTPEEQRELKIERFGYDPTIPSKYLGSEFATHQGQREKFDFYWKAGNGIDICYEGCNGNYLSGKYDPENKTLIGLPEEFTVPFFDLLEKSENV
jgi:hypothetical protein